MAKSKAAEADKPKRVEAAKTLIIQGVQSEIRGGPRFRFAPPPGVHPLDMARAKNELFDAKVLEYGPKGSLQWGSGATAEMKGSGAPPNRGGGASDESSVGGGRSSGS